jgi:threonyl-tRNA synthetase
VKILLIHAEKIWYKTKKPAIRNPPDPPGEFSAENVALVFTSIEKGDGEKAVEKAAREIVQYAGEMVKADWIVLYPYAHLSNELEKPYRAHKILVMLEEKIEASWKGGFHRAPFGWYKEFEIHGKGHPLAELSRTIKEEVTIVFKTGETIESVEDAARKGLIPKCFGKRAKSLSGLAGEKEEAFGLKEWNTWIAQGLLERLSRRLEILAGLWENERVISHEPFFNFNEIDSLKAVVKLYEHTIRNGVVKAGSPLPLSVYQIQGDTNFFEELSQGLNQRIIKIKTCGDPPCLEAGIGGEIIIYSSPKGYCIPIGFLRDSNLIVGPLGNIIRSAIDYEAYKAESSSWIPRLPAWLHPITAYIIPVSGFGEYALTIARDLASVGAGVIVDESQKSVGARVRKAGKLWVPLIITIGRREAETGTVTVRRRWRSSSQEVLTVGELVLEVRSLLSWSGVSGFVLHLT